MFIIDLIVIVLIVYAAVVFLVGVPYMFYREWRDEIERRNEKYLDDISS